MVGYSRCGVRRGARTAPEQLEDMFDRPVTRQLSSYTRYSQLEIRSGGEAVSCLVRVTVYHWSGLLALCFVQFLN